MVIFLGKTNSGDKNYLNPLIHPRDTLHNMVLKKIGVTPSVPFALILTNTSINVCEQTFIVRFVNSDENLLL